MKIDGTKIRSMVLCSTNRIKLKALKEAAELAGLDDIVVKARRADSGVNNQPVGFDEMLQGALNRCDQIREKRRSEDSLYVGIENGLIIQEAQGHVLMAMDVAVICIMLPNGRKVVSMSPGISIPLGYVYALKDNGFEKTTVGELIARKLGGNPQDPHKTLTKGQITRKKLLIEGMKAAFAQL